MNKITWIAGRTNIVGVSHYTLINS